MPTLAMAVSKAALQMIKAGEAVLSSGGVRTLGGQLIELAKPVAKAGPNLLNISSLNPVLSGVNLASSIGNNVQSAFIQKSLNEANYKLDNVLDQLHSIANSMNAINTINVLSWANMALGLANCGISLIGFKMTFERLGGLSSQLGSFIDRYKQDQLMELTEEYERIRQTLIEDIDDLTRIESKRDTILVEFKSIEIHIRGHIVSANAFLKNKLIPKFNARQIDGRLGCEMIFTLSELYARVLNEFHALSYYVNNQLPRLSGEWMQIIKFLLSSEFTGALKLNLFLDPAFVTVAPDLKYDAIRISREGIRESSLRLEKCVEMLPKLTLDDYLSLDASDNVCVLSAIVDHFPELQDGGLDKRMASALEKKQYIDNEDSVIISMGIEV